MNISRPILDKILDGQILNETTFLKHLEEIAKAFQLSKGSFLSQPQIEQTYAAPFLIT